MRNELRHVVQELGVESKPVCLHTSLRSFGTPRAQADHLIEVFLDAGATVMAPTFTHGMFGVRPPPHLRPPRNGSDYDRPDMNDAGRDRVFDPSSNEVDESLGTLPRVLLRRPGRIRGNHPISSFTAIGPLASQLITGQHGQDVFAPLARLGKLDGIVLLIGVGLTRMTLLHLAEKRSGRVLFRRWANGPDGEPVMVEAGGCSEGFGNFEPALAAVRREVQVRESRWQVFPARSTLNLATHAIRINQRITHCGQACLRCDDAVAGGPLL